MPHADSSSPRTGGRVEECGGEHSDEKDEETSSPSGWKNVSEDRIDDRNNVSSASNINNSSSSSSIYHNEESFVDKIRSNFSCMFSKMLPFRLSKDIIESSHNQQEVRRLSRSLATQTPEDLGQVDQHSQNVPESNELNNNKSLPCEMAAKRRRLCESEEKACNVPEPPKTLGRFNTVPAVQNRRLTGFLGNAHYHKCMQQKRHHGNVHKPLFGSSHLQSTRGRNDSLASSQRPSFKPSVTAVAKSLTTGYIPPEYGGSPFYEGFTRYGGASAAQMLARYDPNLTAVTTLIRRKIPTENGVASSSRGSTVPYPSQRILAIVDKYATNRSDRTAHSKATLRKSPSPPMVQSMCVQNTERSQETVQQPQRSLPPIVPLMEYTLPVQLGLQPPVPISPIERKKQSTPTGGKQTTKRTRIHAKPVKEPELSKVQPVQLPNVQLPPLIKGLPQFDNIVPLKGRTLPVADNVHELKANASDKEIIVRKHDRKKTPGKTESSTASTLLREINTFVFARPQVLGSWSPQLQDDSFSAATKKFKFAEPEPLHDEQPPVRSFKDLMADSVNRWACEVCMVRNEPHKKTCVACNSSMPKSKETKPKESKSSKDSRSLKESKPRESKSKESKPRESKSKESKPRESKSKESKPRESKSKESKSKDLKSKESKSIELKLKESESKELKSKESKPKESKPKESKSKELKPKESQPKESKPKESKPKEPKPEKPKPEESKPKEPKPEEPKPEEPKPVEAKQHRSSRNKANTSKTTSSVTTNDSEPSKRWKCTACKVRNEPTVSICVSCAKKKSSSSSRTDDRKDRSHKKESTPSTTEKTKP